VVLVVWKCVSECLRGGWWMAYWCRRQPWSWRQTQ
jgi:hypothetical protein